ncbi:peptidyl-prolyl cis-trans isomerase [Gemmatimonas sp.]|uniref:peptidyl-prolyl cis-trans isomerase n=1 Tax=Gemmatimonas sp. TaxID=1962908 RepID=UPI0027B9BB75|nr:peptidyl-prolyl cis-trans isomerase [Gemmatimonas sp.]
MLQSMRSAAKYIWIILIVAFVGSFLLYETSGLAGRAPVTTTTSIATVNGEEILLTAWQNAVTALEQERSQQTGNAITLDERQQLEERAFNELVTELLLQQEYKRRGITVTDDEILQAARLAPPPQAMQSPDLQTDGKFDIQKYQRFLSSPLARQSGALAGLEAYYRTEIPKQKLFDQVASGAYITDERLWQMYRDRHDSATVSYVVLSTAALTDTAVTVTDAEISAFYDRNKKRFERPGRAVVSLLTVTRAITAADSADAKRRIDAIRTEIAGGAKFEDVAKRSSTDTVSGANGGALGKGGKGRFTPKFEEAAYALKVGELSQPVLTPFGWHLIRVDARQGDTLDLRHILVNIAQSDSSATRTDRRADSLASKAGSQDDPKAFDAAAKQLGLTAASAVVLEKEPLSFAGRYVPSVSAWAFSGVRAGETSDLFDSPDAYYLARLDSLTKGGLAPLAEVKGDIRRRLARDKRVEKLRPIGEQLARAARASSLEAVAAERKLTVEKSAPFTRVDAVPGLGQYTQAVGAAFAAPTGQVTGPFNAVDAMVVMRVDARTESSRPTFEAEKSIQRQQYLQSARQQKVDEFLTSLRESVKVEDRRSEVLSALRRQSDS